MSADRLWSTTQPEERKGLTVPRVVEAAIALADVGGLERVSMARVAKALDVTPMALYRHVASKEELLVLMVDAAVERPPTLPPGDWRTQLEAWSWALLEALREHPWFVGIPLGWAALGPNRVAWMEQGFAALAPTPLTEQDKASVMLHLNNVVFAVARTEADFGRSVAGERHPVQEFAATLDRIVADPRFPHVAAAVRAGVFADDDDPDGDLRFDLQIALDGIARLVATRAARDNG